MKKVQAIIRPQKMQDVKKALTDAGVSGMTVREVSGHGKQKGFVQQYRAAANLVTLLPKVEIEVVVNDDEVEHVIQAISDAARTGEPGDGKIFVVDVQTIVRIRTGERDGAAV